MRALNLLCIILNGNKTSEHRVMQPHGPKLIVSSYTDVKF